MGSRGKQGEESLSEAWKLPRLTTRPGSGPAKSKRRDERRAAVFLFLRELCPCVSSVEDEMDI